MVHGLAAQLGGQFILSSALGQGTRADLYIPIADKMSTPEANSAARTLPLIDRPLTILLVDDEDIVRLGTAEMIRDLGHTVSEARNGAEALAMLADGLIVDAVVTDYKMPRMNGAELARRLHQSHPDLPILIITGYTGTTDDVPRLPRLPKPFGQAEIAVALASLVNGDRKVIRLPSARRAPRA
jgi:CheY-like chemotaxis protein